jgi:hypothetical protein
MFRMKRKPFTAKGAKDAKQAEKLRHNPQPVKAVHA